ncbi:MAG: BTAD domain-containing putative transcriptional regulator [Actinomycetota bacterium]
MIRRACALLRHPTSQRFEEETSGCGGMGELVLGLERIAASLSVVPVRSGPSPARVEIRLLGELRVRIDGDELVGWRSPTGRALLARLATAERRRMSVDDLLRDVWPDAPFEGARNRVHVAIHKLRRVLGPDIIGFDGDDYVLGGTDIVRVDLDSLRSELSRGQDAAESGRPREAMSVLRGALEEVTGGLCAGLRSAEWLERERGVVEWRVRDGLHLLSDLAIENGDLGLARRTAQLALGIDPADEAAHRLLIRCHVARGRDDLAREQLHRCSDTLDRELGVAPLPETAALLGAPVYRRAS